MSSVVLKTQPIIASVLEMALPAGAQILAMVGVTRLAHEPQRSVVQHHDELERRARFGLDSAIGLCGAAGRDHDCVSMVTLTTFGSQPNSTSNLEPPNPESQPRIPTPGYETIGIARPELEATTPAH